MAAFMEDRTAEVGDRYCCSARILHSYLKIITPDFFQLHGFLIHLCSNLSIKDLFIYDYQIYPSITEDFLGEEVVSL